MKTTLEVTLTARGGDEPDLQTKRTKLSRGVRSVRRHWSGLAGEVWASELWTKGGMGGMHGGFPSRRVCAAQSLTRELRMWVGGMFHGITETTDIETSHSGICEEHVEPYFGQD